MPISVTRESLAAMYETVVYANQLLDALIENKPTTELIKRLAVAVFHARDNCGLDDENDVCPGDNQELFDDEMLNTAGNIRNFDWVRTEVVPLMITLYSSYDELAKANPKAG